MISTFKIYIDCTLASIIKREFIFIKYIKKVQQMDYPDNGLKSTRLTGPGQDIGRQAGTNCIIRLDQLIWINK